ncbi:MAG: phenylpyruvate tautomerase MIF-related protein [Clostridia bacterium]
MPYIAVNTSQTVSEEQKVALKSYFGEKIGTITGKRESGLMVHIKGEETMYFAGEDTPAAFVEIRLFGPAPFSEKNDFANLVYTGLNDILSIDTKRIYINFAEFLEWGSGAVYKEKQL